MIQEGYEMRLREWVLILLFTFFLVTGFLTLLDQYLSYGIWFQIKDIHHETFALTSFALAIGILVGYLTSRIK